MRTNRIAAISFSLIGQTPLSIADPERIDVEERIDQARHGPAEDVTVTVPVAQRPAWGDDTQPTAIIRGSSLVGPLRAHLATYHLNSGHVLRLRDIDSRAHGAAGRRPATLADLLCGSEPEEIDDQDKPQLRPSPLRLVLADMSEGLLSDGHTRVAIDRRTGAAAATKLFRREEVTGTRIDALVQIDLSVLESAMQELGVEESSAQVIEDVETALCEWSPRLGGQITTGSGEMTIDELRVGTADPIALTALFYAESTVQLLRDLATDPGGISGLQACSRAPLGALWALRVDFEAAGPLLVAPRKVADGQHQNISQSADNIPGSAWRGVLRSRCEFILRSCGLPACESTASTCGRCPTCQVFGWSPHERRASSVGTERPRGEQGLIRVVGSPVQGHGPLLHIHHAPIDRFTGGAAAGKLFTHRAFPPFSTTTVHVEEVTNQRPVPDWAKDLLMLALLDISDGYVGVGHATTRGYGSLVASKEFVPAARAVAHGNWYAAVEAEFPKEDA